MVLLVYVNDTIIARDNMSYMNEVKNFSN